MKSFHVVLWIGVLQQKMGQLVYKTPNQMQKANKPGWVEETPLPGCTELLLPLPLVLLLLPVLLLLLPLLWEVLLLTVVDCVLLLLLLVVVAD